jgi:hypothetical protein
MVSAEFSFRSRASFGFVTFEEPVMVDDGQCPKCGPEDRIPDVHVHGGYHARSLKVEIVEKPEAWIDKGIHEGVLTARICGRYGFAELYVNNPEELLEAYRQKQSPASR